MNELLHGKYLKLFLNALENIYFDVFHSVVKHRERSYTISREPHILKLRRSFPYYNDSDLSKVVDTLDEHFLLLGDSAMQALNRMYVHYLQGNLREDHEKITPSNLYHFVQKQYLAQVLSNGFTYPSIITIDEYVVLMGLYKGAMSISKTGTLKDEDFISLWNDSNSKYLDLRNSGSNKSNISSFLGSDAYIPAYSCFTELHSSNLEVHANHYGGYGLCFKKNKIVSTKKKNNEVMDVNFIRPIHYCQTDNNNIVWLLLEKIRNTPSKTERMALFTDLILLKPIHQTLYHPDAIYSVFGEQEWRYVSSSGPFSFSLDDLEHVVISKFDQEKYLAGNADPVLEKLLEFLETNDISYEAL